MKKFAAVAVIMFVGSSPVWASLERGSQLLNVNLGMSVPLSDLKLTGTGGGNDKIGELGFSGGGQYVYHITPQFGVGAEINSSVHSDRNSSSLILNGDSTIGGHTIAVLLIARSVLIPEGNVHPFFLGGIGFHNTSLRLDTMPTPGFVWLDTRTTERRTLTDSSVTAFAGALGGGVDIFLTDQFFVGFEGRWQYFGSGTYGTTSAARTQGLTELKGDLSTFNVLARLGLKFGSVPSPQIPVPPKTLLEPSDFQTQVYETEDLKTVMKAILNVLDEEGYLVKNATLELGFITATKEVPLEKVEAALFGSWEKTGMIEATINVNQQGKACRVRTDFQAKKLDNRGSVVEAKPITQERFYRDFFRKVEKGIALKEKL